MFPTTRWIDALYKVWRGFSESPAILFTGGIFIGAGISMFLAHLWPFKSLLAASGLALIYMGIGLELLKRGKGKLLYIPPEKQ